MELKLKLVFLNRLYEIYNDFISHYELACKKGCSHCCTGNVTVTTLEAFKIITHLQVSGNHELLDKIRHSPPDSLKGPSITTNELASLCMEGKEIPEENEDFEPDICPLLHEDECPLYEVRPFGCRCFVSKQNCIETGFADTEDFVFTVNNFFLQNIEHLDDGGCTGNLSVVLNFLMSERRLEEYKEGGTKCSGNGLIPNRPIEIFMIPPEHLSKIDPLIQKLREIKAPVCGT